MNSELLKSKCEEVEKSPDGRYIRYNEFLGSGAFKDVYKGFDQIDRIEVAWNQISIEDKVDSLEQFCSEAILLKSLNHETIMRCFCYWVDNKNKTINMITELLSSGSLKQYRKIHQGVSMAEIKNWGRQILQGIHFLHTHNPPIVHRDLKCDNIFVNGNHEIKIGDLGLATIMEKSPLQDLVGTPGFMAPEFYDEEYNELVDIYAFGMCILELVTGEYPYGECVNAAQIFKKVTSGIMPIALGKVENPQVKEFIEKCLAPASQRLSAVELLKNPFLASEDSLSENFMPESVGSCRNGTLRFDFQSVISVAGEMFDQIGMSNEGIAFEGELMIRGCKPSSGNYNDVFSSYEDSAILQNDLSLWICSEVENHGTDISISDANYKVDIRSCDHGIMPAALGKVEDSQVKDFIEKCLVPASERLSAVELLKDPFLASDHSRPENFIPELDDSQSVLSIAGEMYDQFGMFNEDIAFEAESLGCCSIIRGYKPSSGYYDDVFSSYEDSAILQNDLSFWMYSVVENHGAESYVSDANYKIRSVDHGMNESMKGLKWYGSKKCKGTIEESVTMSDVTNNSGTYYIGSCDDLSLS